MTDKVDSRCYFRATFSWAMALVSGGARSIRRMTSESDEKKEREPLVLYS
jgi:hypothetical protein